MTNQDKTLRKFAMIDAFASAELVERPTPGAAPTAWRIWAAGPNEADGEVVYFTEASAQALVAEQAARARQYSIDFDHLSLSSDRAPTAGRASGWHNIELRADASGQSELWACMVEWCADAKAGLEAQPPLWKYFSPAFRTNSAGEIVSYINMALCINPLTHGLPALAAVQPAPAENKGCRMKNSELAARLRAMADESSDDSKKEALTMAAAAFADMSDDDKKEPEAKAEEPAPSDDDKKEPEAKAEKKAEEPAKDDEEKKEYKHSAALAAEATDMKARLDRLEVKELLDGREDLTEATRKWCLSQPRKVVESFLASVSKQHAARSTAPTQGDPKKAGLEGRDLEEMNAGMGMKAHGYRAPERRADGSFVLHVNRPSDVRAAQKGQG